MVLKTLLQQLATHHKILRTMDMTLLQFKEMLGLGSMQSDNSGIGWFLISDHAHWYFVSSHQGLLTVVQPSRLGRISLGCGSGVGWYQDGWKGLSWMAFKDKVAFVKLYVASVVTLCLEICYFMTLFLLDSLRILSLSCFQKKYIYRVYNVFFCSCQIFFLIIIIPEIFRIVQFHFNTNI
ncbi:hypothetical protein G4B88_018567, partial [Cannabis sativa]